ncbi:MAG: MBL fold metallo-hydrolase [Candidatus Eisenbacteria bacterium]
MSDTARAREGTMTHGRTFLHRSLPAVVLVGLAATLMGSSDPVVEKSVAPKRGGVPAKQGTAAKKGTDKMLERIHWLGHASFRIDGGRVIYFDPFQLKKEAPPADVIFISHEHSDHCSPKDVARILKEGTVIVTTADCAKKLSGQVKTVKPGDKMTVAGLEIEVVPSYNVDKQFHQKAKGWVGFIVTLDGVRIYHAGDTDFIPEMKSLKADVAFLPVGGTYTMNAAEAVKAADAIKPQIAIPMHYGSIVGTDKDAETFKKKCSVRVEILKAE